MTFGGVPRRWTVPATHCTAANGGTRTSTLCPGASCARAAVVVLQAAATASRDGRSPSPRTHSATASTADRTSAPSTVRTMTGSLRRDVTSMVLLSGTDTARPPTARPTERNTDEN